MLSDRVPAVIHARPAAPLSHWHDSNPRWPPAAPGEMLAGRMLAAVGDDVLADAGDGLTLRLLGLARQAHELNAGDLLTLRVAATAPRVVLELLGTRPPAPHADTSAAPAAAMQRDQAAWRRIAWTLPEPAALALQWRRLMLLRDARAPLARAALTLAGTRLPLTAGGDDSSHATVQQGALPLFAWGGVPAVLQSARARTLPGRRRGAANGAPLLRLEILLPELGAVVIEVRSEGAGIALMLGGEGDALHQLHAALPTAAAALAAAGVRLLGVDVLPLPALAPPPAAPAEAVSPALFRALSEVAVALLAHGQQLRRQQLA